MNLIRRIALRLISPMLVKSSLKSDISKKIRAKHLNNVHKIALHKRKNEWRSTSVPNQSPEIAKVPKYEARRQSLTPQHFHQIKI